MSLGQTQCHSFRHNYLYAVQDAYTKLYYNGAEKLATTNTGIDVTGTATMDGLVVVNSTDTQGKFSGWSAIGANSSSGAIELGQASAYQGIMSYVADSSTRFLFDNTYGSTGSTFEFRTNTAATAKTHLKIEGSGDISFYEDTGTTAKLFWDASAESLGIGTSSPQALVDLSSATTSTLRLSNRDAILTENQITGQLEFYQSDASGGGTGITGKIGMRSVAQQPAGAAYYGNSAAMEFYVSGQTNGYASDNASLNAMTIQAGSGRVGIGTSSPSAVCDIVGTPVATGDARYELIVDENQSLATGRGGGLAFARQGVIYGGIKNLTSGASDNDTDMHFQTRLAGTVANKMVIKSSGNVGIGTSSPAEELDISADAPSMQLSSTNASGRNYGLQSTNSGKFSFYDGTAGVNRMVIDSSGNVGIGTTLPDDDLHIANTSQTGATFRLENTNTSTDTNTTFGTINFEGNDNSAGANGIRGSIVGKSLSTNGAMGLLFSTASAGGANTERMRIDSSGNLLVGRTSTTISNLGVTIPSSGAIQATANFNALGLNRLSGDGAIALFQKSGATVGSIGTNSGLFIGSTYGTDAGIRFASSIIAPSTTTGANRDAAIDLGYSSSRFKDLYLSSGVYLGGTGAANKLDDYEEGLHLVTIAPTTSGTLGLVSSNNQLAYTKVGNLVHVSGYLYVNVASSPVGAVTVSLPFASADLGDRGGDSAASLFITNINSGANISDFIGIVVEGSSNLVIYLGDSVAALSNSAQQMKTGTQIKISLSYKVA